MSISVAGWWISHDVCHASLRRIISQGNSDEFALRPAIFFAGRSAQKFPWMIFHIKSQKNPSVIPANVYPAWVGWPSRVMAQNPIFSGD
jgi:hypothetical protein